MDKLEHTKNGLTTQEQTSKEGKFEIEKVVTPETLNEALSVIRKNEGQQSLHDLLSDILNAFIEKSGVKNTIGENQVNLIIEFLTEEHPYFTLRIAEIKHVLKQATMGHYGDWYKSLDVPTIMTWFNTYLENRINTLQNKNDRNHDRHKSDFRHRLDAKKK